MTGKYFFHAHVLLLFLLAACGPSKKGLFGDKRSEHEKYSDRIKEAGLDKTQLGSLWFFAATKSLAQPLPVALPYKETGYFAADKPASAGYVFNVRRGEKLLISVSTKPANTPILFTELWLPDTVKGKSKLLAVADSTLSIRHEVEKDGRYLVRLQPELLQGLEYTVTITTGPSLAFPVSESGNPKIVSFWHDSRDRGARVHEGVDITGKFRTPAVAIADGYINSVTDNRLGGKVVFMRPKQKDYTLYYAHLDTQIVNTGDEVKTGQVIGLIGNTGNARNTAPHLHFGIYASGGAVDPFPFINPNRPEPKEISAPLSTLNKWIRTSGTAKMYESADNKTAVVQELEKGEAIKILSATSNWYKIQLADGREGFISSTATNTRPLTTITTDSTVRLLDNPNTHAAAKLEIKNNSKVEVVATYADFYLVNYNGNEGWIVK
jgi:murein DD-endopeptidase MepM/ murein hydrolase activator NlpD